MRTRKLAATFLLYTFGLDTVAFAAARPVPREAPPRSVTRAAVSPMRAAAHPEPAPLALAPAPLSPILLDGGSPQLVSCDHDAQGAVLVASVGQSTSVDFNVDPPACSGDPDLCGAFSYDKSGPTPDTWKAIFDASGKKLRIETGATVSVVNVPASSNNQKAPGLEIKSSCGLEVQAGASVSVGSVNQPAGDIFVKVDGDVQIDGTVRNSVTGTNGTPGKITIASCFGDLLTGPQSRIETIGVDPGGKDINLLTCPDGGDIAVNGLVRAVHKYGATPNVNVVSFGGSVTIDGRNDFGEEVESGTTIRRTSGLLARTTNATLAGKVRVQAKHDVTVLGNRILNKLRTQYGAVAVKPHSTNGQGGDGDLIVRALEGGIVASDRAFDFENRFNALNAISLEAKTNIALSVTAAINDGAADNTKAVVSTQGGSAGQGGANTLRSFSGQITIGQKAQVLANFSGTPGTNGSNALIACGGVLNSGTVTPADANLSDDSGTCTPAAPIPLFTSCEEFGVFPPTGPQNQPPTVNAGPDLSITLPAAAVLDATVSDDGLPPGGSLAVSWAKLSGPGTVAFGNPSAVDTTATFSVAGTYELRLTATDSELLRSDDVIVFVGAANQAPSVDAGPDKTITLPTDTVTLDGIVSDDGLPAGSGLVISWSVVSGPGSVTFGSPNAAATTATFQVQGTYELRLSATDGALSSSDTAIVTVAASVLPIVSIADAAVVEGNGGVTLATLTVTLSTPSAVPVTVDYTTADGTATACDYATRFGTLSFGPNVLTQTITVPVFSDLLPESTETVSVQIGNPSQATLGDDSATLTITDDDVANAPPLAPSNLQPPNGASDVVLAPTLSWTSSDPDAGDAVVHDVYFGTQFGLTGQLWSRLCAAAAGPALRSRAATAYDEAHDRLILFGGQSASGTSLADTWLLENATGAGGAPQWTALAPAGPGPSARRDASAVYDAAGNRLIVHGGCEGTCETAFADTWALTNANGIGGPPEWVALPDAPVGRAAHAAAWDPSHGAMLVFAGTNGVAERDDVWVLRDASGSNPSWDERISGVRPSARKEAAAAYDAASDRLIVFGGRFSPDTPLADSWVLQHAVEGTPQWLETTPSVGGPAARYGHVAGYEPASKRLLIFGGTNAGVASNLNFVMSDSWLLTNADGSQASEWVGIETSDAPTGRFSAAAAYSPSLNRLAIALGANDKPGAPALDDLWSLADAAGSLPLASQGQTPSTFQPGTLTAGTTYYWKILARDSHGAIAASPARNFIANYPAVSVGPASLVEGNGGTTSMVFTLTLSRASEAEAHVDYQTVDGSAVAGQDFTAAFGTLVFPPNTTTATVTVNVTGDPTFEPDESFELVLSNPQGAVLGTASATGTILNDDAAPVNQPPTADAGADQTTILPSNVVALAGSASDDGLPAGSTLTVAWSVDSGPAGVTFTDTAAATTSAAFVVAGTYVLRLTASDGSFTASDAVMIAVLGPNQAPQVNAGTDIIINVPQTVATLSGSVTDDGLPLGNQVSLTWSLVSGPGSVTFADASALTTTATFGSLGDFTIRLTATDGALSAFDDVLVTVAPQPDLTVSAIDASGLLVDAQTLEVSGTAAVSVANLGPGGTQAPFMVAVFEDRNANGTYQAGVDNLLGTAIQGGAGNGQTVPVEVPLSGTVLFSSNLLYAFADSGQEVPEVDEANNYGISSPLPLCEFEPPAGPFTPILKWSWAGSTTLPANRFVFMQPAVADLNGDGDPDVVFAAYTGGLDSTGRVRVVNGATGTDLFTIVDPPGSPNGSLAVDGTAAIALGDIDGDGRPEIVTVAAGASRQLIAFEHDGTFKWRSPALLGGSTWGGAPAIGDLDGDGIPEIVIGNQVLNNNGTLRWTGTGHRGILSISISSGPVSLVADLDLDGVPEVLAGGTAYRANGSTWWSKVPFFSFDGFTAVGNFDADPFPEIVLQSPSGMYMLEHDGTIKWGPVATSTGSWITVADVDSDGVPEIIAAGGQLTVRDATGQIKWSKPVAEFSGLGLNVVAFDFEGDGFPELVHSDNFTLRVFRGTDGAVLFETPAPSCTAAEGPVVADVDADGHADIVAVQSECLLGQPITGLKVFSNPDWVGTRKIWNQATYHINNVNDDSTIPAHEQPSWLLHNTYRSNLQPGCGSTLADLTASFLRIVPAGTLRSLTVRIGNGGSKFALAASPVSFYDGDPRFGGTHLGTAETAAVLLPGQFEDVTLTLPLSVTTQHSVWIVADDRAGLAGIVKESDETNNDFDSGLALVSTLGAPDLVAVRVETLGITADWQTLEVSGTVLADVRNQGEGVTGIFDVAFFEDRNGNGTYEAGTDNLLGSAPAPGLGPGESASVSAAVSGSLLFRDSPIYAFADSGLVIAESNESNNLARSGELCASQPASPFSPALEWSWTTTAVQPAFRDVNMTPAVADLNGDGIPDVIFTSAALFSFDGYLRAISGKDGSELFTVQNPAQLLCPTCGIAVGDIDGDGRPEIVGVKRLNTQLLAFEHDGTLKWQSATIPGWNDPQVSIANVDGAGLPEIVVGHVVLNADGTIRWTGTGSVGMHTSMGPISVVADLDLDGVPEVIAGNTAYRANGTILWRNTSLPDGFVAIGNFDTDPYPEVVLASGSSIWVLEHDTGAVKWGPVSAQGAPGPPIVADLDGDGRMEIGVVGSIKVVVLEDDGRYKWIASIVGGNGVAGLSAADLDGDGASELLVGDATNLRIYAGRDGTVLFQTPVGGLARLAYPVVADVDGDGNAEVVAGAGVGFSNNPRHGIFVYGDPLDRWTGARKIWNQHSYHVTNVNDDGTIPLVEKQSWIGPNGYRNSRVTQGFASAAPDVTASYLRTAVAGANVTLTSRVGNAGLAPAPKGMQVAFFNGNPASGGTLLGSTPTTLQLKPGEYQDVSISVPGDTAAAGSIFVIVDQPGNASECNEANNIHDSGLFLNRAPEVSAGPDQIVSFPTPVATLNGTVTDDGLPPGAAVTSQWQQISGPGTVTFGDATSPTTTATFSLVGDYVLRLSASDTRLAGEDDVSVTVTPPNGAPSANAGADQIIGLPANSVALQGTASDDGLPVGSTLTVAWTGPAGVSFGSPTSLATTATFATSGTFDLTLTASDGAASSSDTVTIIVDPLNQAPQVSAGPSHSFFGFSTTLAGSVTDDGLPRGNTLTKAWTQVSGPGTVTFADASSPTTQATFSVAGTYRLRLTASDGEYVNFAEIDATALGNAPPAVDAGADQSITFPINSVLLSGTVTDDGLPAGSSVSVLWSLFSGPAQVSFSNPTATTTTVTFDAAGTYVIRLTATDGVLSAGDNVTVTANLGPPIGDPPVVTIASPTDGAGVTAPTDIVGQISSDSLLSWKVQVRRAGEQDFTTIQTGNTPVSGVITTFDPTLLLNGQYEVVFRATDTAGRTSATTFDAVVKDNLKVGNFTVSFTDLEVPLAGMPIRVTRTYDSRDKQQGDFGYGWRLDVSNVKLQENGIAGNLWFGQKNPGFLPQYCLEPTKPVIVTVTTPDGRVHEFQPNLTPTCVSGAPPNTVTYGFQPRPGTTTDASLRVAGNDHVIAVGSWPGPMQLYDDGTYQIFDPDTYVLSFPDGREFTVHQTTGLKQIKDLNNNILTVNQNGITHSSGLGIAIARDAQGRVTSVTDPDNNAITYAFDANGDLQSVTDREDKETTFTYFTNPAHLLDEIKDPLGRTPIKNEYDATGRLIKHTDAFLKTIEYTHNIGTRQEVMKDRNDKVRVLEYDERGNVVKEIQPDGRQILRTFDGRNNRTSETEPHETTNPTPATTSYVYDAIDNLLSVTDANNNTTEYTYNARKQVLTTKDPKGKFTVNTYDVKGNLLSTKSGGATATGPFQSEQGYTYTAQGNVSTQTVTVGGISQTTSYVYDSNGNLSQETDATGHVKNYVPSFFGNRLSESETRTTYSCAAGNCTPSGTETLNRSYEYDKNNRLTKTIDPDGTFTRTVYDALGRQKETYDKLNRKTEFTYDDMGRLTKTTYPDLTTDESTYDPEGRRLTSKDRANRTTTYIYDDLGRLIKTTFPDLTFTENFYDAAGRLTSTKDARGKITTYEYDSSGRRTKVKDPLNNETVFTYDTNGNQKTIKDARLNTTTYDYDDLNRRTKTTFADSSFAETTYDEPSRRPSEKDQAGRVTQFQYDKLSRLTKVIDALLQETTYGYDELGNRIRQTDANGRSTWFVFDKLGREIQRHLPDGSNELRTYDAAENLKTRTDFMGRVTSYDYDDTNRLTTRTYPNPAENVSFTYTATGRRLTAVDARGTTSYGYDTRDRLTSLTQPGVGSLGYAYDGSGNRTSLTATIGATSHTTTYSYDDASRLDIVTDPAARAYDHGYDPNGNRTSLAYPNGTNTSYVYNSLNRLTNLTVSGPLGMVFSQAFTLGPSGNRTQIVENDGTTKDYSYDSLYRLTNEAVTIGALTQYTKAFTYDAVGNRLQQVTTLGPAGSPGPNLQPGTIDYGYDTRDRLLTENANTLGYDSNGNLTSKTGEATYTWSHENRLIRVTKADGSVVETDYDADGARVQTRTTPAGGSTTTTNYLVETSGPLSHVVAEVDTSTPTPTLTALYVRSTDDLLSVMRPVGAGTWTSRFYVADGIGSIRRLTDESGLVSDGYSYTAFGELLAHTGTDPQPYSFAGEPLDPNSGFQYHRARWMDPTVGRFTALDPLAGHEFDPPSLHRYLYAHADAINKRDPSGQNTLGELAIVGAILGTLAAVAVIRPQTVMSTVTTVLVGAVVGALLGHFAASWATGAVTLSSGVAVPAAVVGLSSAAARYATTTGTGLQHGFRHVNTALGLGNWNKASADAFRAIVENALQLPYHIVRGWTMARGGQVVDIYIQRVSPQQMLAIYVNKSGELVTTTIPTMTQLQNWGVKP